LLVLWSAEVDVIVRRRCARKANAGAACSHDGITHVSASVVVRRDVMCISCGERGAAWRAGVEVPRCVLCPDLNLLHQSPLTSWGEFETM
jgi:hypothetical protein